MADRFPHSRQGPFRADQLQDGDRYELTDGRPIYCAPSGAAHANRNLSGGSVLETDPAVDWAGVDAGFAPQPGTLRAPNVAIGSISVRATKTWMPYWRKAKKTVLPMVRRGRSCICCAVVV